MALPLFIKSFNEETRRESGFYLLIYCLILSFIVWKHTEQDIWTFEQVTFVASRHSINIKRATLDPTARWNVEKVTIWFQNEKNTLGDLSKCHLYHQNIFKNCLKHYVFRPKFTYRMCAYVNTSIKRRILNWILFQFLFHVDKSTMLLYFYLQLISKPKVYPPLLNVNDQAKLVYF